MCHFITATHSSNINLTDINKIAETFTLKFQECNNEYVNRQISTEEKYIFKCTNICDCGTAIGEASVIKNTSERVQKSEVDKLKRKGWTDTKINRWLTDKKKSEEKTNNENEAILKRKSNEIENWINFLRTLFKTTNVEHFGLLLHWYSNGLENEKIKIGSRKVVSQKSLTELDFKMLQEDTLLYVGK
jgi:hypothetical protein